MKVVTWNVNSVNVRLPNIIKFIETYKPDVLCLQELKCDDSKYPLDTFDKLGYTSSHACQKTYNGVSILSRKKPNNVLTNPIFLDPNEKRSVIVTVDGIRIINLYVVNGKSIGSDKYKYKLDWLSNAKKIIKKELEKHKKLILLGDFNIAPNVIDSYDPDYNELLCSDEERQSLKSITNLGLYDCYIPDNENTPYTWWDYRSGNFYKDIGFRIDLILATGNIKDNLLKYHVHRDTRHKSWCIEQPKTSDHAPVSIEF